MKQLYYFGTIGRLMQWLREQESNEAIKRDNTRGRELSMVEEILQNKQHDLV
jgi:hypothetical protein